MKTEKLEFAAIRYNPELEGFEAAVRIHEEGVIFTYPVYLRAPLEAHYSLIAAGLTEKAQVAHRSRQHVMRSITPKVAQISALAA